MMHSRLALAAVLSTFTSAAAAQDSLSGEIHPSAKCWTHIAANELAEEMRKEKRGMGHRAFIDPEDNEYGLSLYYKMVTQLNGPDTGVVLGIVVQLPESTDPGMLHSTSRQWRGLPWMLLHKGTDFMQGNTDGYSLDDKTHCVHISSTNLRTWMLDAPTDGQMLRDRWLFENMLVLNDVDFQFSWFDRDGNWRAGTLDLIKAPKEDQPAPAGP